MRTMLKANTLSALAVVFLTAALTPPPEAPVADAAERGDIEAVRALLREGADVNAAQGDGMTALHWSALSGRAELVSMLLYAGAEVEAATRLGSYTALHLAAQKGLAEVVGVLLDAGADPDALTTTGVTPLHFAAESGDVTTLQALVAAGADVNARDGHSGRTPLMFATGYGRTDAVRALLSAGADVSAASTVVDYRERAKADQDERRKRARLIAAARGEQPQAQRGQGGQSAGAPAQAQRATPPDPDDPTPPPPADPDRPTAPGQARQSLVNDSTRTAAAMSYTDLIGSQGGLTALHYAARDGRLTEARLLLEAGADVNQISGGDQTSALLIAAINGNYDLAMMLLEHGADPNLVSDDGVGPLFAVVNGRWALRTWYPQPTAWQQQTTDYLTVMKALLEAGAEPNTRVNNHIWYSAYNAGRMGVDFMGATAFWRAAYSLDVAAMRLLVSYGADPNIPTMKPPERRFPGGGGSGDGPEKEDPSGLPPVPVGGPGVHPLIAASGVGYGTSRVGQQHVTVPNGWLPAVRYLVDELGVDVNVRDHDGYSALHNAASRGDDEMIRYLVSKGADVMVVSRRGQTTVDMANGPQQRVQPFPSTIELLEGLGAKNNHNCQSC
ncbi:MAG: ankyrin repeat domain-containing protein [Gemmatimonadota bacterium]